MVHKPENVVDLDSAAIIAAEVRSGDSGDTRDMADRILDAAGTVDGIYEGEESSGGERSRSVTADKGYHDSIQLGDTAARRGQRTVIAVPTRAAGGWIGWSRKLRRRCATPRGA